MEKVGRNDPCPCGSGKKFKKCCETKTKKHEFTILSNASPLTQKVASSLFRKQSMQDNSQQPGSPIEKHGNS